MLIMTLMDSFPFFCWDKKIPDHRADTSGGQEYSSQVVTSEDIAEENGKLSVYLGRKRSGHCRGYGSDRPDARDAQAFPGHSERANSCIAYGWLGPAAAFSCQAALLCV
jgi:hypothetical protein